MNLNPPNENAELQEALKRPTRILVVDDEEAALLVIPEALRDGLEELGWSSVTIETAASGEEALELAASGSVDLLVADVVMPGIDGIETYARLKEQFPNLACVVMTAHAPEHSTPIRALRLGAADYVRKPVHPDYLVETCHRQLIVHHLRRAAEESRRLLEAIVNSVDAGVVALRDRELLFCNEASQRLVDATETNIVDRLIRLGLEFSPSNTNGAVEHPDLQVSREDTRTHSIRVVESPVLGTQGERLGNVFVMRDVTYMMERKAMESFKRMAAIAAHEMKNSVTGLGLVTEHLVARLQQGKLEVHETTRMAEIILEAIARLDRFARSFLGFSRIPDPKPLPASPNVVVSDAVMLYSSEKGLPEWASLECALTEDLPLVSVDRDLMFQVLQNLILNAIEAMEETSEGLVRVETALEAGDPALIRISVIDQGVGIADHMHERIFEPNVTTREAGSGLGLVIVRDIVHKHGGHVRVRSTPGEGACFDILLPIEEAPASP